MHLTHNLILKMHIVVGLVAIVAFWLPVATRKGSRNHIRSGQLYTAAMLAVSVSAIALSLLTLLDPVGVRFPARDLSATDALRVAEQSRSFALFLLMLGILVLTGLRHGTLAIRQRRQPGMLAQPRHRALIALLLVLAVAVGYVGLRGGEVLLIIFAALSLSGGLRMWRESGNTGMTQREALIAHFNGLIGTGIGAYTALFAFGGRRLLSDVLSGYWQILPWVAPAIIGSLAISAMRRRYQAAAVR